MIVDLVRSMLVFAHLLFFSGAIALVIWTDYSVLKKSINDFTLVVVKPIVVTLFVLLWVSGFLIVYIDTGYDFTVIFQNPKLVLKLLCVFVLTFNGMSIHYFSLKIITRKDFLTRQQAIVLSITGAISTSHWLLAGYIGSADMLSQQPIKMLLALYFFVVVVAGLSGLLLCKFVQFRLNWNRAQFELDRQKRCSTLL